MRLKPRHLLLAVIALAVASPALAAKGHHRVGFQFGRLVPSGEFATGVDGGFDLGVAGTVFESADAGIGLDATWHAWRVSDEANAWLATWIPGSELGLDMIQTTAHVVYDLRNGGQIRPYGKCGFGLYWVRTTIATPSGRSQGSWHPKAGYSAGAGANFEVSPTFDVGFGGMYHVVQDSGPDATFFRVGMSLSWGR